MGQLRSIFGFYLLLSFFQHWLQQVVGISAFPELGISALYWWGMSSLPSLAQQWKGVLGWCALYCLTIHKTGVDCHVCWYNVQKMLGELYQSWFGLQCCSWWWIYRLRLLGKEQLLLKAKMAAITLTINSERRQIWITHEFFWLLDGSTLVTWPG